MHGEFASSNWPKLMQMWVESYQLSFQILHIKPHCTSVNLKHVEVYHNLRLLKIVNSGVPPQKIKN